MVETRGDGISVADGVMVPGVYVITSKRRPNQTQRCSSSLVPHGADSSAIVAAVAATRPVVVTPGVSTARTAIRDGIDAAAELSGTPKLQYRNYVLSVTGLLTFYFSKLKTKKEKMEHPTQTLLRK